MMQLSLNTSFGNIRPTRLREKDLTQAMFSAAQVWTRDLWRLEHSMSDSSSRVNIDRRGSRNVD